MGFKSIRMAIFYVGLSKPNATLLLYPGLGPAMLRRLRRESLPVSIGGVSVYNAQKLKMILGRELGLGEPEQRLA